MENDFVEIPDPNGENSEPTESDIANYLAWLGGKLPNDADLLWIARDALKAPLPPGWKLYQQKDGRGDPFYFNRRTGESLWDHPSDRHFQALFATESRKKSESSASAASTPVGTLKAAGESDSRPVLFGGTRAAAGQRELAELQDLNSQRLEEEHRNFKTQIATMRLNLEDNLKMLRQRHEREKAEVDFQHTNAMKRIRLENADEVDAEAKKHAAEIAEIRAKGDAEIREEKARHEREGTALRRANLAEESGDARAQRQSEEIDGMKRQFEAEEAKLRQDLEAEKTKLASGFGG
jgi:hypothetical protein